MMKLLGILFSLTLMQGPSIPIGGTGPYPATAPSIIQSKTCSINSSPGTCAFSSNIGTGDNLHYYISSNRANVVFTPSSNCGFSGYVKDVNTSSVTVESGHAVGGTAGACTVTFTYTGGGNAVVVMSTFTGNGNLDVVALTNSQTASGTGTDAITSNSVTTTTNDLCLGYTRNTSGTGTISAGTSWTIPTNGNGNNIVVEWLKPSVGSLAATFTASVSINTVTGISCFKP